MNIQYVRLDDRVCEVLNRMAAEQRRTVSDLVNEILRDHLAKAAAVPSTGSALSGKTAG